MDNLKELNLEVLGKISGGTELDEDTKSRLNFELRLLKSIGAPLETILKEYEELSEYITNVWDDLKPLG